MKTFKQFLNEMALPLGKSPSEFSPPPGNYKAKDVLESFLSIGKKIGKGSSRIAIKVDVESSQFTSPLPLSIKENSSFYRLAPDMNHGMPKIAKRLDNQALGLDNTHKSFKVFQLWLREVSPMFLRSPSNY